MINTRLADYGLLDFDRTQNLVFNYIYTLPRVPKSGFFRRPVSRAVLNDWQVSSIMAFTSGSPMTPGDSVSGISSARRC